MDQCIRVDGYKNWVRRGDQFFTNGGGVIEVLDMGVVEGSSRNRVTATGIRTVLMLTIGCSAIPFDAFNLWYRPALNAYQWVGSCSTAAASTRESIAIKQCFTPVIKLKSGVLSDDLDSVLSTER